MGVAVLSVLIIVGELSLGAVVGKLLLPVVKVNPPPMVVPLE